MACVFAPELNCLCAKCKNDRRFCCEDNPSFFCPGDPITHILTGAIRSRESTAAAAAEGLTISGPNFVPKEEHDNAT